MVQRTMEAGDDSQRKNAKLVILTTAHGYQLFFRNAVGPCHIFRAFRADHYGMGPQRDTRNIQYMIVVRVCDQDIVCPWYAGLDGRLIRRRRIFPTILATVVTRGSFIRWGKRRRWPQDSGDIGIYKDYGRPVTDPPTRCS